MAEQTELMEMDLSEQAADSKLYKHVTHSATSRYMSAGESLNWAATGASLNGGVSTTDTIAVCLAVSSMTSAESDAANSSNRRTRSAEKRLTGGADAAGACPDSSVVFPLSSAVAMASIGRAAG